MVDEILFELVRKFNRFGNSSSTDEQTSGYNVCFLCGKSMLRVMVDSLTTQLASLSIQWQPQRDRGKGLLKISIAEGLPSYKELKYMKYEI